ncbi:MAG: potassium channel family protein [Acidobacteria bacterium]|nr:potassium channel family protein [Acidobacteriota bacterium]MCA1637704.1 potassium channel family protein [Acidobacteriota bacterium]
MTSATNILVTAAGLGLLVFTFYDIYKTILRATKRQGLLSEFLNRSLWRIATSMTHSLNRRWRHRVLTSVGPLLMPLLIAIIVSMLITGFALVYLPRIETDFNINERAGGGAIMQAFYFSGVTLLTIGYGDMVPVSGAMRLAAMIEAACGLGIISLSITYLLSVYGALERKRAVALTFYHQARQGADVSGFITNHFARGHFYSLTETLRQSTRDLDELLESHLEHSVIHYFHPLEVYKGLPRALFIVLETTAVLNAHVSEKEYVEAGDHPDVLIASDSARHVLAELVTTLKLGERAGNPFETEAETRQRRRNSFNRAWQRLQNAQIKTRSDVQRAFDEYSADRDSWEKQLFHLADFLGYDWDEVTGDRSLDDATDNEVAERHEPLTADNPEASPAAEAEAREQIETS